MRARLKGVARVCAAAGMAMCMLYAAPAVSASPVTAVRPTLAGPALTMPSAAPLADSKWWGITRKQARVKVRHLVPRSSVVDVRKIRHRGYRAYAVTLERRDGSTLTGFIDRSWGVIFDWKVGKPPRT